MNDKAKRPLLTRAECRRLLLAFAFVLVWCAVAHGYAFSNLTISHDSMKEFYLYDDHARGDFQGTNIDWKIALGRFLVPVYHAIFRGPLAIPWLAGVLTVLWLSLAVWLTARLFSMNSPWLIALTAGIFTANLPVTAMAAAFIHDLDANMFAVLAAVFATFLWARGGKRSWLAILPLVLALGIYQCMVSVAITLMMLICLLRLMDGQPVRTVLRQGLRAIVMLAIGGGLYAILVRAACRISGVSLIGSKNGLVHFGDFLSASMPRVIIKTYRTVFRTLLFPPSLAPRFAVAAVVALLFLVAAAALLAFLADRTVPVAAKLLAVALVALAPLGMNLSCFINAGATIHHLMMFPAILAYLACLLLARWLCGRTPQRHARNRLVRVCCGALAVALLWTNVQTANAVYVKREIERQETFAYMTRVVDDIEDVEGYIPGETPVAMFGRPVKLRLSAFESLYSIVGQTAASMISNDTFLYSFFQYGLKTNIRLVNAIDRKSLRETADAMPRYPQAGSIQWAGDVLVVNLDR